MKIIFFLIALSFADQTLAEPLNCDQFLKAVTSGKSTEKKFKNFLDVQWKYLMTEFPEWATAVGYPGQNDRWADHSMKANARRDLESQCQLQALNKLKAQDLRGEDRISYNLAVYELKEQLESKKFGEEYLVISQMDGIQLDTAQLILAMPNQSPVDFENILKRFESFPTLVDQNIELMNEGLRLHVTPVRKFMTMVLPQIDKMIPDKVEEAPFYQVFLDLPSSLDPERQKKLRARAQEILLNKVYPAFQKHKKYLAETYIPACREFIAFTELPNGVEWYNFKIKASTTTDLTADELHSLGLKEVERISQEMAALREKIGFKGDAKAFSQFLLHDPQFFYSTENDLLMGYRDIAKRIDPELVKMFKTLPRLQYGVRAMLASQAPAAAGAQYSGGSAESGRPGYFEANTYDLKSRPKWGMETLTFHEAVPGHHFQISIAQELTNLPEFRKQGGFTAYIEGWALYAEGLGDEMGFYKDPYSKYGNLAEEMMRAVRLVVDTGMHAKGWSHDKALEYYRNQLPVSDIESESEINRYISWPGQALAYKVGQLKFRELRDKAKLSLGEKFDIREFHDEVLRHGALPLKVLEDVVNDWISTQKKRSNDKT